MAILAEEEVVEVELVLVVCCGVFFQRKASRFVVKDDELGLFDEQVIDSAEEDIAGVVLPADAFEIASPDFEQVGIVEELADVFAFRVLEFGRKLSLVAELVKVLFEDSVHAAGQ